MVCCDFPTLRKHFNENLLCKAALINSKRGDLVGPSSRFTSRALKNKSNHQHFLTTFLYKQEQILVTDEILLVPRAGSQISRYK